MRPGLSVAYQSDRDRYQRLVVHALNRGVGAAASRLASGMRSIMSTGAPRTSSAPGTPPNVQRGQLRNSMQSTPGRGLRAFAGTNVKYGRILDRGGTIYPKNARMLAVPLGPEGRRASELVGNNGIRSLNLVPAKNRSGTIFLKRPGKGGEFLFKLQKSVHIRERPWAMPAVRASSRAMVATFARVARQTIRAGFGGGGA